MNRFFKFLSSVIESGVIPVILSIILVLSLIISNAHADCTSIYAKIGTGYKIHSIHTVDISNYTYKIDNNSPLSARIELGLDCGNLTYGIAHYSQWLDGPPLNSRKEYSRTEVFIDYKFEWRLK